MSSSASPSMIFWRVRKNSTKKLGVIVLINTASSSKGLLNLYGTRSGIVTRSDGPASMCGRPRMWMRSRPLCYISEFARTKIRRPVVLESYLPSHRNTPRAFHGNRILALRRLVVRTIRRPRDETVSERHLVEFDICLILGLVSPLCFSRIFTHGPIISGALSR